MQLICKTEIRKSVITVSLETVHFTPRENQLLDQFGEMEFKFEKSYDGDFTVAFNKKIRSNFKIKVKFDGSESEQKMEKATNAANQFIEDVQEQLDEEYDEWIEKKSDLIANLDNGVGTFISDVVKQEAIKPAPPFPNPRGGYRPYHHI